MRLSCDIVKDLLPLYAEGMVSPSSREAVDEHIGGCAACREALAGFQQETVVPVQTNTAALEHLQRKIRRRRIDTALLAILVTAAVLLSVFMYLYAPIYLSAEEAVVSVTEKGDIVTVELSAQAEYCRWEDSVDPDTGRKSVTFIAARHRWNVIMEEIFGSEIDYSRKLQLGASRDIWYASTDGGEEDTLLWGQQPSGGRISLPRLVLGYYFWMALGTGILLALPALLLRKKKAGKVLGIGAVTSLSFVLSDLIATGGNWRIYDGHDVPIHLALITVLTILLTLSVVFGVRVWRTNREE